MQKKNGIGNNNLRIGYRFDGKGSVKECRVVKFSHDPKSINELLSDYLISILTELSIIKFKQKEIHNKLKDDIYKEGHLDKDKRVIVQLIKNKRRYNKKLQELIMGIKVIRLDGSIEYV